MNVQTRDIKILDSLEDIQERRDEILGRYAKFKAEAQARREKLEDSLRFQYFKRDAEELESWINDKLQAASDETFSDSETLQAGIQKHQVLEAEVASHTQVQAALDTTGMEMVNRQHYSADLIKERLDELQTLWEFLQVKISDKSLKLQEALSSIIVSS